MTSSSWPLCWATRTMVLQWIPKATQLIPKIYPRSDYITQCEAGIASNHESARRGECVPVAYTPRHTMKGYTLSS